jgi:hypothetical protein
VTRDETGSVDDDNSLASGFVFSSGPQNAETALRPPEKYFPIEEPVPLWGSEAVLEGLQELLLVERDLVTEQDSTVGRVINLF